MSDETYVATRSGVVVYNADRSAAVTLAKGGAVPAGSDAEHVKTLLSRGLVEKGEAAGGLPHDPDEAPPFPGTEETEHRSSRRSSKGDDG